MGWSMISLEALRVNNYRVKVCTLISVHSSKYTQLYLTCHPEGADQRGLISEAGPPRDQSGSRGHESFKRCEMKMEKSLESGNLGTFH